MSTLTGKKIKDTYDGLLKTSDQLEIPASGQVNLEDGLGNSTAMTLGRANNGVSVTGNLTATEKIGINETSPTHRLELYDDRSDDDSDDYTVVIKTSLPSPIPTPNPGTGGIKAVFSEDDGSTFPYGISMVPGTNSSDVMSATNLAFYSNSDLDTVSATGLRAIMDNAGTKIYGNLEAGDDGCSATGANAVALNQDTTASGLDATATGEQTTASGRQSFAGGFSTTASGDASFAVGGLTQATSVNTFAAGAETTATAPGAAAFNNQADATGVNSFAMGGNTTASGEASLAGGVSTVSSGIASVSSGLSTTASGNGSHASGVASQATGLFSSAQGDNCLAQGQASIAMGYIAEARGQFGSAAIGFNVDANGQSSLAVNQQNVAQGNNSIAAGFQTNIDSNESMGMGFHCKSQAGTKQDNQFLFGRYLNAPQSSGGQQAGQSQFVVGRHNQFNSQPHTAFTVGTGSGVGAEANSFSVQYDGNVLMHQIVNKNFTSDSAAAAGGVPVGGVYHNAGDLKIRLT